MKEIIVRGVSVYIETDKEGYVSILTDGIHPTIGKEAIDAIVAALRSAQTDDDREHEAALQACSRQRLGRSPLPG